VKTNNGEVVEADDYVSIKDILGEARRNVENETRKPRKGKMYDQIKISMALKTDDNGDEYLVGTTDMPVMLDLSNSLFLVFFPLEGKTTGQMVIRRATNRE